MVVPRISYYNTGAFIVDAFSEYSKAIGRVPDAHKSHLDHYREMLAPTHIQELIGIAQGSITMLQDYIKFLENELEVSE